MQAGSRQKPVPGTLLALCCQHRRPYSHLASNRLAPCEQRRRRAIGRAAGVPLTACALCAECLAPPPPRLRLRAAAHPLPTPAHVVKSNRFS